jgi:hypothetical protein
MRRRREGRKVYYKEEKEEEHLLWTVDCGVKIAIHTREGHQDVVGV